MKLCDELLSEIQNIDWERAGKSVTDMRLWTNHGFAKAIHRFVTSAYKTTLIADGVFVNTTNQPTPPGVPVSTPTVAVMLTPMPPHFPGHKELYEFLKDWSSSGDLTDTMTDTFGRIFVDWLSVLNIPCGQDSTVALPLIPPGAVNVAPPYFHSMDGSTLPSAAPSFTYENAPVGAYPADPGSTAGKGATADPDAKGAPDGFDAQVLYYDAFGVKNTTRTPTALAEYLAVVIDPANTEETAQIAKASIVSSWLTAWETATSESERLTIAVSEARRGGNDTSTLSADAEAQQKIANDIDTAMLSESTTDNVTSFTTNDYPSCLARSEAIVARKAWFEKKKAESVPKVDPPTKAAVVGPHPDAPPLEAKGEEPNPPAEQTWTPNPAWAIVAPAQVTWPNYAIHAQAVAAEIEAVANAGEMKTMEDVWTIVAKHLLLCLNDNILAPGGGSGYCYGAVTNIWSGAVNGNILWSES